MSSASEEYWRECISQILHDIGLKLSAEQVDWLVDGVIGCAENQSMMLGYDVILKPSRNDKSTSEYEREIKALKERIAELEHTETVYKSSVARRRNVSTEDVYIEGERVMINVGL